MEIKISLNDEQSEKFLELLNSQEYEMSDEIITVKESNVLKSAYRVDSNDTNYYTSKINGLLTKLNIKKSNIGHTYIIDALKICLCNELYLKNFKSLLYPVLADRYHTTPTNVERNIRYQINKIYSTNDDDVLLDVLGKKFELNDKKPLSNSEFISCLVSKLKLE